MERFERGSENPIKLVFMQITRQDLEKMVMDPRLTSYSGDVCKACGADLWFMIRPGVYICNRCGLCNSEPKNMSIRVAGVIHEINKFV